jgi:putative ABC transport system permease protein
MAIAVVTLALGMGASTAIFTVVNALLLRPLPFADPGQLVQLGAPARGERAAAGWLSYGHFQFQRDRNRSFDSMAACTFEIFNLTGHGDPEQVPSARISWNFFQMLGVSPRAGRTFLPEEDRPGANPVAMISSELWHRMFGGDANAVGRTLTLDSRDYTIVGIVPPGIVFPMIGSKIEIWAPRVFDLSLVTPARVEAGGTYFHVAGRLRPGVSREQARDEAQALYRQYRQDNPGKYDATIDVAMTVDDLHEKFVANARPTLLVFVAAVGLVLLIACSNVASLQVARAVGRRKEFAVRTALGGPRSAIVTELLMENVALALLSAGLGIVLALAGAHYLAAMAESTLPQAQNLRPDGAVFGFAAAVAVLAGVAIGFAPAVELSKADLNTVLRDEGRGSTGSRSKSRVRGALVVAQVALSTVMLVGSGLLIHSFERLSAVRPGFEPRHLLTLEMALPTSKYPKRPQLLGFYEAVLRNVQAAPGVESAALSTAIPAFPTHQTPALFEGQPVVPLGKRPIINLQQLSPGYARTLRIPRLAGRVFMEHDDAQSEPVAVVNQTAARRFWPNQRPVGKHVWVGNLPTPFEVVGVLGDVKNAGMGTATAAEIFLPYPQLPWSLLYLSVRTAGDPRGAMGAVRRAIAAVDREQPLTKVQTAEELLASANAQPRFTMLLIAVFSAAAFAIAAVGIYGVIAYSVTQRTQELGIRMAVGAARGDVFRLVIGNGLRLTAAGLAIGFVASLAATRLIAALLYQTSTTDWLTFAASAVLFATVSVAASYVPARRAAGIDPTEALR